MSPMSGEVRSNKGPSGLCEVREVKDGLKLVTPAGDLYHITKENIPEWIKVKTGDNLYFELNLDETRLKYLRPYNLSNIALRFAAFAPRIDGIPTPQLQKGGPGKGKWKHVYFRDQLKMTAILEIGVGDYQGMTAAAFLNYIFKPIEAGYTGWIGSKKQVQEWENFLYLFGINFETDGVAFSENVLPAFEALLLERDGFAMGNIEEGQLGALFAPPVGYTIPPRPVKSVTVEAEADEDE